MRTRRTGLSLIELLLTIAVLGILAGAIIPQLGSDIPDRLNAAAQVVAADLDYARSLAVANDSKYLLTFDTANNFYYLRHSGTNAILNTLPAASYRHPLDTVETQTTDLTQLPTPSPAVELVAVTTQQGSVQLTTDLEFNSLGGTTAVYETQVWLTCSRGSSQRFVCVYVNPTTGLASIGPIQKTLPSTVLTLIGGIEAVNTIKNGKGKGKGLLK